MIAPVVPLPSCPVVRAQRAWGGKERLSAEERSDSPHDPKSGGREQAEVASTSQPASLSSDSEDGGLETRQQGGQTTVLHTAARLDDPLTSSNTHVYGSVHTYTNSQKHAHLNNTQAQTDTHAETDTHTQGQTQIHTNTGVRSTYIYSCLILTSPPPVCPQVRQRPFGPAVHPSRVQYQCSWPQWLVSAHVLVRNTPHPGGLVFPKHFSCLRNLTWSFHLSSLFLTHSLPPSFTHSLTLTLSLTLCGSIHKEGVHLACADALIDAGANLDHMVRSYVCMCALHVCMYICVRVFLFVPMSVCTYLCLYVPMSVCAYVCMCLCWYVPMSVCAYVGMCLCLYVLYIQA